MTLVLPWQSHVPDPSFLKDLEGKRIMLDVCTLLRAILFKESYSARLIEHIERATGAVAIICPHVRNTAILQLQEKIPARIPEFSADLLSLQVRKTVLMVPDGDTSALPAGVAFDPADDDIVIATALGSGCDALATLDYRCATHAAKVLKVLQISQRECNKFFPTLTTIDVPIFSGERHGSIAMEVMLQFDPRGKGRRYVMRAGAQLGLWLDESSGRFQVGIPQESSPLFCLRPIPTDRPVLLAVSYDCTRKRLVVGFSFGGGAEPECDTVNLQSFPKSLGPTVSILPQDSAGGGTSFWRGVMSSAMFVDVKPLKFALHNRFHFDPLDAQRFHIEDAVYEPASALALDLDVPRQT